MESRRGRLPRMRRPRETLQFQAELIVPDPSLSVKKGAIKPWRLGSQNDN